MEEDGRLRLRGHRACYDRHAFLSTGGRLLRSGLLLNGLDQRVWQPVGARGDRLPDERSIEPFARQHAATRHGHADRPPCRHEADVRQRQRRWEPTERAERGEFSDRKRRQAAAADLGARHRRAIDEQDPLAATGQSDRHRRASWARADHDAVPVDLGCGLGRERRWHRIGIAAGASRLDHAVPCMVTGAGWSAGRVQTRIARCGQAR